MSTLTNTSKLLNDIARCHDELCGARLCCSRFVDPGPKDVLVPHYGTLKPMYHPHEEPCDHYIEAEVEVPWVR